MLSKYKAHISKMIVDHLQKKHGLPNISPVTVKDQITSGPNQNGKTINFSLQSQSLQKSMENLNNTTIQSLLCIEPDTILTDVKGSTDLKNNQYINFHVDKRLFTQDVLANQEHFKHLLEGKTMSFNKPEGAVIVEFSSPNIAKPFHVGHLRSTIIGNFVANLHEFLACDVVRLNYLGDWGTQLGLLDVGLDRLGISSEALSQDPIRLLYEAYVEANRCAEIDASFAAQARDAFTRLESKSDADGTERWQRIREVTVSELAKTYSRLGIHFDEYHWESMYSAEKIQPVLNQLKARQLIESHDGKQVVRIEDGKWTVMKNDGSSLYLSRDLAAAMDRYQRYTFGHCLYVVDSSQANHFTALTRILSALELPWAGQVTHIPFGRVTGMSTRKGNAVFLHDILNEAKELMLAKQESSSTTKISSEEVADKLGVSAVIISDLKQKRMKNYKFSWNNALQSDGDTGVKLQYTHCRLASLERNIALELPEHCDPDLLAEPVATILVQEIARFEEVIVRSHAELEASVLVRYLFKLCNATSKALKKLNVKGESRDVAQQRLLLFNRARITLYRGLKILGIEPLEMM